MRIGAPSPVCMVQNGGGSEGSCEWLQHCHPKLNLVQQADVHSEPRCRDMMHAWTLLIAGSVALSWCAPPGVHGSMWRWQGYTLFRPAAVPPNLNLVQHEDICAH